jgi:hypothetical protein
MVYEIRSERSPGHQPRYALGGPRSAASVAKPSEHSMARIVSGSRMVAMSCRRPPHARQTSTSTSKALCINCAHVQPRRDGRDAVSVALGASVAVETAAVGGDSTAGAAP